jgi:uncharacterized protein YqkB
MHIHFTQRAAEEAVRMLSPGPYRLKLLYDTDGCGCAVNGIAQLWAVDDAGGPQVETSTVTTDGLFPPLEVVYEKRHEVFFEERLTIDFDSASRAFVIKSNGQYYNPSCSIVERRHSKVKEGIQS